ncbi:MAG: helix-turn-helix domain-containing protein [Candidatus Eremiobacteraeota bacterium]|nr:helix-turn-helix domain-containing protein [Candidatus Eremiobacteraeota bacterium]
MSGDILDFEEAVLFLKTSKPTLYRWVGEGRIRAFKAGREWRFYRADLLSFIESGDQEREGRIKWLRQARDFYEARLREKDIEP